MGPRRTVQVSVQFRTQKGCETHFQASHPWRTYARVYVSLVNVACLNTETPFRCATGLRHVPRRSVGQNGGQAVSTLPCASTVRLVPPETYRPSALPAHRPKCATSREGRDGGQAVSTLPCASTVRLAPPETYRPSALPAYRLKCAEANGAKGSP